MTEVEMVGWPHRLNGHEFQQAPGDGEGQGSLVCYIPWGHKVSDMTEQLWGKAKLTQGVISKPDDSELVSLYQVNGGIHICWKGFRC